MVKPPNRSISEPAVWIAVISMLARKPSTSPTATCTPMAPISDGVSMMTLTWAARWGAAATARAADRPTFTCTGIMRLLNGGAITTQALARTRASRKAMTSAGSKDRVNGGRARLAGDESGDHVEQLVGEPDH